MKLYPLVLATALACHPTLEDRMEKVVESVQGPLEDGVTTHEYFSLVFSSMEKQGLVQPKYYLRTKEVDSMLSLLETRLLAKVYHGLQDDYMGTAKPQMRSWIREDIDGYDILALKLTLTMPRSCTAEIFIEKAYSKIEKLDLEKMAQEKLMKRVAFDMAGKYGVQKEVLSILDQVTFDRVFGKLRKKD